MPQLCVMVLVPDKLAARHVGIHHHATDSGFLAPSYPSETINVCTRGRSAVVFRVVAPGVMARPLPGWQRSSWVTIAGCRGGGGALGDSGLRRGTSVLPRYGEPRPLDLICGDV